MFKKIIMLAVLSLAITACGSSDGEGKVGSVKVKPLQKNDKNLSCREILLEMNEAQFYQKMAHKNRGVKLKNMLMPLGYISTYMDSEDAIGAAQARVEYLDKIYEIMHCEEKEKELEKLPLFEGKPQSRNSGEDKQYSSGRGARYYLEE